MSIFSKLKSYFSEKKISDPPEGSFAAVKEVSETPDYYEVEFPFVEISTSGDENVCPMCRQFNKKLFRANDVPPLPLHPFCGCAYMYRESAGKRKIYKPSDFILPAPCTKEFCNISAMIYAEKDITKRIELCESGLRMLKEFLSPYISAGWEPPPVLPCAYGLIFDYQSLGDWDNARRVILACIDAGAYSPEDGEEELERNECVKIAAQTLVSFLTDNPGELQRNIYRKLCPPCDRDALKWVLAKSLQIRKEKADKTNRLYVC